MTDELNQEDRVRIESALIRAFSPHSPISQSQLFRGRKPQIRAVVDAAQTPGLHAAIYGERGVGKTSLANMARALLADAGKSASKVICAEKDTFESVMRRSLSELSYSKPGSHPTGYATVETPEPRVSVPGLDVVGPDLDPDSVAARLTGTGVPTVLFIDEFDRLSGADTVAFADLIKSLSDRSSAVTVVIVGVAEDINALIKGHASVERCLRQVHLQRMSDEEVDEIVHGGLEAAGMKLDSVSALGAILKVSQGFPHYAHLLAQNAARAAIDEGRAVIQSSDVYNGMFRAVDDAEQSQRELYHKAVTGTKKENLWTKVVAACAMAVSDDRGYFSGRDVQEQLSQILKRETFQQTLAYHLGKLTEVSRGPLLERIGPERRYRYRFLKPFIRPYILMRAINDKLIFVEETEEEIKR